MILRKMLQIPFNGNRIKKTDLDEFFPVMIEGNPTVATPVMFNTSGDIAAMMQADGLGWQPADKMELTPGEILCCLLV